MQLLRAVSAAGLTFGFLTVLAVPGQAGCGYCGGVPLYPPAPIYVPPPAFYVPRPVYVPQPVYVPVYVPKPVYVPQPVEAPAYQPPGEPEPSAERRAAYEEEPVYKPRRGYRRSVVRERHVRYVPPRTTVTVRRLASERVIRANAVVRVRPERMDITLTRKSGPSMRERR